VADGVEALGDGELRQRGDALGVGNGGDLREERWVVSPCLQQSEKEETESEKRARW
jgi:hypothetical protein